jgi:hypothetical protein
MKQKMNLAFTLAVVLAMLLTSVALADAITPDADLVQINNQASMDLGTVAPGAEVTTPVSFILACGGNKHVDDGQTVAITFSLAGSTVPVGGGLSATNTSIGPIPASWPDDGNNCPNPAPSPIGDNGDSTVTITAPTVSGTYTYVVAYSRNVGTPDITGGNATVTFTLKVFANTPPSVSVTGVTNGESYEFGAVPAAVCSVTDAEDGNSTFAATLSAITGPLAAYGLGNRTASCSYTDGGGLGASDSATYAIVDTTPPTITFASRTPANAFGWNNGDVTGTWSCADAVGVVADTVSAIVSSEGANQSALGTCQDVSGLTASDTQSGIYIDKTAPVVSLVGGPANGGVYYFGFVPAAPTCTATDELSGLNGPCLVSGYSNAVGAHTVAAGAGDQAGNAAVTTASYTVLAWTLKGFYQPVDMNGVYNVVKGGSTVPLKFEVFAGDELTLTSFIKSFVQTRVACDGTAATDEVEVTTTGGTSLRYDPVAGQFIQNWQTPKLPGTCYKVTMTTLDGSSLVAFFRLK